MRARRFLRSSRPSARAARPFHAAACDPLEQRIVLAAFTGSAPLPDPADMEDPANPVVRLVTNFGDIDLELFTLTAPRTAQNFLFYVDTGRYDETFAHRLVDGFVVQWGGFTFRDANDTEPGFFEVPTEAPIENEFNRSNTERTLSFAKVGGDPDSADSQWFINLADNSENLDNQNGGFSVFARVLDDRSWSVVLDIADSATVDLTSAAPPFSSAFTDVPVRDGFDRGDPREAAFVYILDAEVIRPNGAGQFFQQRLVYPEGFRGNTDTRVVLSNPNNVNADFQLIVRYETGAREEIIGVGSLDPHANFTLTYQNGLDLIRPGVPYSLEFQSYLNPGAFNPLPISAEILHRDNFLAINSSVGESFFDPERLGALRVWGFGGVPAAEASADPNDVTARIPFIVWQNLEAADGFVSVTIYQNGQDPIVRGVQLDAKRRGGIGLAGIDGVDVQSFVGVRVISTVDIVASMSFYENIIDTSVAVGQGALQNAAAFGSVLMPQINSPRGALADVRASTAATPSQITFTNPSLSPATVTLSLVRSNGALVTRQVVVPAEGGRAFELNAAALGLTTDESLTAYYNATFPVFAHYLGIEGLPNGRYKRTGAVFTSVASNNALFAAGALPNERLIVFNPATRAGHSVNFQVQFHFADGDVSAATGLFTLAPFERIELNLAQLASTQTSTSPFGVAIVSERRVNGALVSSPLIASRYRADNGVEVLQTSAILAGPLLSLNDRTILA